MYSKEQIIKDITNYMDNKGVQYWYEVYVGISKNPEDRLFNGHGVQKDHDPWIYRRAFSSSAARDVEAHFINLGTDGGTGGGDETTIYVYAYKKAAHTNP